MKNLVVVSLALVFLYGCGFVGLQPNPDATYGGVTPVITVPADVDPDDTIADEVAEIANPALETLTEQAPANPADWTGWLYALAAAGVAAGGAAANKYLGKKKKKTS